MYDFGVKYEEKQQAQQLQSILKSKFSAISTDWAGARYCRITLEWNYEEGRVDISMPGYIQKVLHKYKHEAPTKPQNSPYRIAPKK